MKLCNTCGASNSDSAITCTVCGSALSIIETPKKGLKLNGKVLGIGAATLAVVSVIFIAVGLMGNSNAKAISNAMSKNQEAIMEEFSQLPNLSGVMEGYELLNNDGNFTMTASIKTSSITLTGEMDYSRKKEVLAGNLVYTDINNDLDVKFDFSSNDKEFLLAADQLTSDVYGFNLKTFAKKFSTTPLVGLLPFTVEKDEVKNLSFFKKVDQDKTMEDKYGDAWKTFRKSLSYKELNDRQMQVGSKMVQCRAFEITWDSAAATKLIANMLGWEKNSLSAFTNIIKQMEPDCRFYVNEEGCIIAVDFVSGGQRCVLTFEGQENIWDSCVLYSESITGDKGDISGKMEIDNGIITCDLEWGNALDFSLDYDDNTGKYKLDADIGGSKWLLEGTLISNDGGVQLELGGYLPTQGDVLLSIEQKPLVREPEQLNDKYVDLMDMDVNNWQRLFIDINNDN